MKNLPASGSLSLHKSVPEYPDLPLTPRTKEQTLMADRVIDHDDLLQITSDIVSAHVANNPVPLGELPGLIQTVYSTLAGS